jgi:hypothetical protein
MEQYFNHTDLAATTQKTYARKLEGWETFVGRKIQDILLHPGRSFEELKASPLTTKTASNYHIYLNACYSAVIHNKLGLTDTAHKGLEVEWKELQQKNAEPLRSHYLDEKPTDRQSGKELEWTEIIKVRDSLPEGLSKLLLSMYTMLNPERADYYECEIIMGDEIPTSKNYIRMRDKQLILTDFKTKKCYTKLTQTVPEELLRQIQASKLVIPRRHVFVQKGSNIPHNRATFSQWANRTLSSVFGKPTTLTCLRHAFVSSLDFNSSLKELDKIATSMGHSVATQRKYKWTDARKNEIIIE